MCDLIVPDNQDVDYYEDMEWETQEDLKFCSYCFDTKETLAVYQTHYMYALDGNVECPKLRRVGCPKCGDTGDKAHVSERCYKMRMRKRAMKKKYKKSPSLRVQLLKKLTTQAMDKDVLLLVSKHSKII